MTDFDAEQWLRNKASPDPNDERPVLHADKFYQCADELAAAKARIKELEACAVYTDNSAVIATLHEQLTAEQAMSRKLYEALQCVDLTSGEVNPQVVIEAIAEYENKERK